MKILLFFAAAAIIGLPLAHAEYEDSLAVLNTNSGEIVIEFFPADAPNHVENFVSLANEEFYDMTVFHRVIKDFMIQGGDPFTKAGESTIAEWGTGDPGHSVNAEFNTIKHNRGIVSMARSADPNSAGSQFFIVHKNSNFLDGQYTVFGRIITQASFETLDRIAALETPSGSVPLDWEMGQIVSVRIVDRDSVGDLLDPGEPDRTEQTVSTLEGGPYTNEKFGIAFDAPAGWLIQEPPKTDSFTPDLVIIGPKSGISNPIISITIEPRDGKSLDEKIDADNESLQAAIDTGQLEIISQVKTTVGGLEASEKNAISTFTFDAESISVMFREFILVTPANFYSVTYTAETGIFDEYIEQFEDLLHSFSVPAADDGGGCLIATAAYGSEMAPQVQFLREIRDGTLLSTESGSSFMSGFNTVYYTFSPAIADLERENPAFREAVKLFITPMLSTLSIMTLAEPGSESQVLALGISVIALNLGMYVAAPAVLIGRLRR